MILEIKAAQLDDLKLISSMAREIWQETYVDSIGQAQVNYMLGLFYSENALIHNANLGHDIFLINYDGQVIGYLDIEKKDYGVFIHKFYLINNGQRKGTGSEVMNWLFSKYDMFNKVARLNVNRKNYKAINFYFKNGFMIEMTGDFDIGGGYFMNDFVMIRR